MLELVSAGPDVSESGLITNANESEASIPSSISDIHSAVGAMSSQSTQTSFSRAVSPSTRR